DKSTVAGDQHRPIAHVETSRGKEQPRRKGDLAQLSVIESAGVLIRQGKIAAVGRESEIASSLSSDVRSNLESFDCHGGVVLPGFVDSHTHPVFTAPRLIDFEKRIHGGTYEEIARAGGGIRSSVESVRKASPQELSCKVLNAC